jgi:hypothetical protein
LVIVHALSKKVFVFVELKQKVHKNIAAFVGLDFGPIFGKVLEQASGYSFMRKCIYKVFLVAVVMLMISENEHAQLDERFGQFIKTLARRWDQEW